MNSAQPSAPKLSLSERAQQLIREMQWMFSLLLGLALFALLFSYHPDDPSFFHVSSNTDIHNWAGRIGAWCAGLLLYLFGISAYWWVALCALTIWRGMRGAFKLSLYAEHQRRAVLTAERQARETLLFRVGFVVLLVASTGLEYLHTLNWQLPLPYELGGMLGEGVARGLASVIGGTFTTLLLSVLFAAGLSWFLNFSWLNLAEHIGGALEHVVLSFWRALDSKSDAKAGDVVAAQRERVLESERLRNQDAAEVHIAPLAPPVIQSERARREKQEPLFAELTTSALPELSLLDPPLPHQETVSKETLAFTSGLIEKKLRDFGVEVKVVAAYPGPVITRYEIEPATGVKGSQIVNLAKDLARSLALVSIRVVETIPGKNCMALELPNPKRQMVMLSEIIGSQVYHDARSMLTVALGKDISGLPVVTDLEKMPHLLVAGTTGSGKSVGINTMILSLLYRASPEDLRLILIDPKMLEMSVYDGIPHLLCPVVTDMRQAGHALNWAVGEMERRYKLMSHVSVRNLAGFNKKIDEAKARGENVPNPFSLTPDAPEPLERLPLIVIVIDELADLMMVVGKKVEELIARIAQKARAAGIHLVLATQRPSVDVITGLIKANVPSRMAFQVSSKIDSRTILDQQGAEALLGQGDMLFLPIGAGLPMRIHGAFASDDEVLRVAEFLRSTGQPNYIESVTQGAEEDAMDMGGVSDSDNLLYDKAVAYVLSSGRASISAVQRELRVGYNSAARLFEQMEKNGVVGPMQSNGKREILAPMRQ